MNVKRIGGWRLAQIHAHRDMHKSMRPRIVRTWNVLFLIAGLILVFFGALKLYASTLSAPVLAESDQILGLTYRTIFILAGTAELIVGLVCLWKHFALTTCYLVTWLATCFCIYRVAPLLFQASNTGPCPCSFELITMGVPAQIANHIMTGMFLYLLLLGYMSLLSVGYNDYILRYIKNHGRCVKT